MPMLLEDLAEETSASNRRAADRLDAEARELNQRRQSVQAYDDLRQHALESARQATDYVVARLPQAEGVWRLALAALRLRATPGDAAPLLRALLDVFESGQRLVQAPRALWGIAAQLGATPEGLDELDHTEARFTELANETKRALAHRSEHWQPADPDRLARGLQLAREGHTVKEEEARQWFRRAPD